VRVILLWILRPFMHFWAAGVQSELAAVPRARDIPQVHAPGVDSDRILIVGSGPAVGWGVLSHDLSLPGALARAVSVRTGRGAVVDVIPDANILASTAINNLRDAKLWRYDAIVTIVGINDAIGLTSARVWKRSMRAFLRYIEDASSQTTAVFVVGIPPIRALRAYDALMGGIAERHGHFLNRVTLGLLPEFTRSTFVPFSPIAVPVPDRYRSPEEYKAWAEQLVDVIAAPLSREHSPIDNIPTDVSPQEHADRREVERQSAVDSLGIAGSAPEERFDRIVDLARRTFHARIALFSIIDNDRQWNKARSGMTLEEFPREGSACAITISEAGAFVIPDTHADERFSHHPFVTGQPHVRFYAGFPVEGPSGERIGALCIMDDKPRAREEFDEVLLRELAMLVQTELWKSD